MLIKAVISVYAYFSFARPNSRVLPLRIKTSIAVMKLLLLFSLGLAGLPIREVASMLFHPQWLTGIDQIGHRKVIPNAIEPCAFFRLRLYEVAAGPTESSS